MSNFLLVHGEWHGAWMWDGVVQRLEAARDRLDVGDVIAVDLPGHGHRVADDIRRITIDYYIEAAVTPAQLKRLTQVTLVAHSFAASFAAQVASRLSEALERIVFIGGILPPQGSTAFDTLSPMTRRLVRVFKPQEKGIKLPGFLFKRVLCNGMSSHEVGDLISRLVSEPYLPWTAPMPPLVFPEGVPLTYVVLARDRFVAPRLQRGYARGLGAASVVELDAGHEAPLTHAGEIAQVLLSHVMERREEAVAEAEGTVVQTEEAAEAQEAPAEVKNPVADVIGAAVETERAMEEKEDE